MNAINFGKTFHPQSMTHREREILEKRTGRMDFIGNYQVFSCKERGWRAEVMINGNRFMAVKLSSRQEAIDELAKMIDREKSEQDKNTVYARLENRETGRVYYEKCHVASGFDTTRFLVTLISFSEFEQGVQYVRK